MSYFEIIPAESWMNFLWYCGNAEHRDRFPNKTESWERLSSESKTQEDGFPATLVGREWFLPLFLGVFPQRFRWLMVSRMFDALEEHKPPVNGAGQ